ncbi:MAG TPA: hypothetical protein VLB27_07565 [candidate division Zixibacteria bacterium]|nr:hypothetical protein [candidate division Zixibacteria bacterium]
MCDFSVVEWPFYFDEAGLDQDTIRRVVARVSSEAQLVEYYNKLAQINATLKKYNDPSVLTDLFKYRSAILVRNLDELAQALQTGAAGKTIRKVMIVGHGVPGNISIGEGNVSNDASQCISLKNESTWQAALRRVVFAGQHHHARRLFGGESSHRRRQRLARETGGIFQMPCGRADCGDPQRV